MNVSQTVAQPSSRGVQRGGAPLPGGVGGVPPNPLTTPLGGRVGQIDPLPRIRGRRKLRADALPEHLEYRDGGCEFATSCLRCPLERCRYDAPGSSRVLRQTPRDRALRQRRNEGAPIEAIALEFGLSRRSVFRILAQERAA